MKKIVLNKDYGGFRLTAEAVRRIVELGGKIEEEELDLLEEEDFLYGWDHDDRMDPALVQVVEEMGDAADGRGDLRVIEIPDDLTDFYIEEYDGLETLHEEHRRY